MDPYYLLDLRTKVQEPYINSSFNLEALSFREQFRSLGRGLLPLALVGACTFSGPYSSGTLTSRVAAVSYGLGSTWLRRQDHLDLLKAYLHTELVPKN